MRKAIKEKEVNPQIRDGEHMVEGQARSDACCECSGKRVGSLIDQNGADKSVQMGEFC